MPGVHAKIRQADKSPGKYLLCPQYFIMKCLSEQSQVGRIHGPVTHGGLSLSINVHVMLD